MILRVLFASWEDVGRVFACWVDVYTLRSCLRVHKCANECCLQVGSM